MKGGKCDTCHAGLWLDKVIPPKRWQNNRQFWFIWIFFHFLGIFKYIYSVIVFKHYFCLRQPRGLPLLNDLTLRPVIFSTSVLKLSSPMANPLFMLSLITLSK